MIYRHRRYLIVLVLSFLFSLFSFASASAASASVPDNYPVIGKVEIVLFGQSSPVLKITDRLTKIEKDVFGKSFLSESLYSRTQRVKLAVLGSDDVAGDALEEDISKLEEPVKEIKENKTNNKLVKTVLGYENNKTKILDANSFLELLAELVNNERGLRGLLPLSKDDIASHVASDQANDLILKGYLSYYNLKNQGPDERYSQAGGFGSVVEVIKGFETDTDDKNIRLTELLAQQLIQAILASQDDSQILFSPYVNQLGVGFALSKDKKKFVSICEFITSGVDISPVKPQANWGEKIVISGRIKPPYKFKAVSIAYFNPLDFTEENNSLTFDNDTLKPYLPPQDYIAYGDTTKSNLVKVIKGLGVIGAIGGAPFTGGATAVLAPTLLSSIQNGSPKEIPLKGGIKANSKGEFEGKVDLNYQGMSGLYLINILAELPGVSYPIVVSRKTIRVNSPLQPVGEETNRESKKGICSLK